MGVGVRFAGEGEGGDGDPECRECVQGFGLRGAVRVYCRVHCTAVILPYWYCILRRWRGNGAVGLRGGFEREEMLRYNTIQYSTIQYSKKCIVS